MNMIPGCVPPMLVAVELAVLLVVEVTVLLVMEVTVLLASVELWQFTDTVKEKRSSNQGGALNQGVANLFEPESYFTDTESYESHPVGYTLLKYQISSVSLYFYIIINDTDVFEDTQSH